MKRFLKWVGLVLGIVVLIAGGIALFIQLRGIPSYEPEAMDLKVEYTPERVARGAKLGNLLCVHCHVDPKSGRATGVRMADLPPEFGTVYARNITSDRTHGIGGWTDGQLYYFLRRGITPDGRYNPIMGGYDKISDEDLYSIIAWLRSPDERLSATPVGNKESEYSFLSKALSYVVFLPPDMPAKPVVAPPVTDKVAHGRYLALGVFDCYGCHSADFKTMDRKVPENSEGFFGGGNPMATPDGKVIHTANITPDPGTGIGAWNEEQFIRAVREGIRPDGSKLRYPMPQYAELSLEELQAIYAYMRTVPALKHAVDRK